MSSLNFAILPPELVLQVMNQVETPRDLFAIVRSSRYLHAVFKYYETTVLVAVIKNAILADNIDIAVAACNAAQVSKVWWTQYSTIKDAEVTDAIAVNKARDEFFENHPRGRALEGYSLRDKGPLLSLYKLWWTTDYFVSEFELKAFSAAARKMKKEQWSRKVTYSERTRLQRAFLRFEIYRRIYPTHLECDKKVTHETSRYGQILPFLKWFPPWEREEILSAQEFLVEYCKDLVRAAGDHVVHEYSNIARDMIATSEAGHDQLFEPEPIKEIYYGLDFNCVDVFRYKDDWSRRRFQYIVGRGLPFIKWLSCLPPGNRIDAICRCELLSCHPTFFEGLSNVIEGDLPIFDAQMKWPDEAHAGKSLEHPNEGWTWGKTHIHFECHRKEMLQRYALRGMGYIFWDAARLHDDWNLPEIVPSMLELSPRPRDDDDRDWFRESSFEERFKDIPRPKGAASRLVQYIVSKELFGEEEYPAPFADPDGYTALFCEPDGYPAPFSDEEAELFNIEY